MARRTTKKKDLTPEEKLAQALVPVEEQPYEVPGNWCWAILSSVAQWGSGGTPSRKNPNYFGGSIPWIKTGELNDDFVYQTEESITEDALNHSSAKLFPVNTVAIAMYGATIGKVGILGIEASTNQACACGVCGPSLYYKYLFYYARSQKERFIAKAKGGAQPNISQDIIKNHPIPVAPLPEQQRIVARIESLFAKLDEAKEKAQAVVDGFEERKAAILHKAFTGELTKQWRSNQSVNISQWTIVGFDDCIEMMQNGLAKRKGNTGEPYVVLRLANLTENGFNENDLREILLDKKEQSKYALQSDDVIMIRVNGSKENVGKQYRILNQKRWAFCDHIIRIKYARMVLPQYMVFFSNTEQYRKYIETNMVCSAGQNTISRKGMKGLEIPIPSIEEQTEIVRILDSLLDKQQQAKSSAEQVLDQIDTMKKAILARAFRGELGTNDPQEESAVELVRRALDE